MTIANGKELQHIIGNPGDKNRFLTMWDVPTELEVGVIPKRIYCSKLIIEPLTNSFKQLIEYGLATKLKTWDGCYNFRPIRGYEKFWEQTHNIKYLSIHSWGTAFDIDAAWNGLGKIPKLDKDIVNTFKANGFNWGGDFTRKDGMHFQLCVECIVEQLIKVNTKS